MGFRRRKPAVLWLPNYNPVTLNLEGNTSLLSGQVNINTVGGVGATPSGNLTGIYPIVADTQIQAVTLTDAQAVSYRLRRIVGKCLVSVDQLTGATQNPCAVVSAGFIILRIDTATNNPIAGATPNVYSTLDCSSVQDPWIWKRTWVLSNGSGTLGTAPKYGFWPYNNAGYPSVTDGPHIDQKTARRVSAEERLFFIISAVPGNMVGDSPGAGGGVVRFYLDYRVLVSISRGTGNKRNASR